MRCLVTGATGHLGSFLVRRLLAEGHEVVIIKRHSSDPWRLNEVAGRFAVITTDLESIDRARAAITAAGAEVVFHLAWSGIVGSTRDASHQILSNVPGSLALFDCAREGGMKTWIGLGSQAEYHRADEILTEHTPLAPSSAYGVAKVAVSALTAQLAKLAGIRFAWLRLLASYGPLDDPRHLIPGVIEDLLAGRSPQLTPGDQEWDYLYVDDAVDALMRVAGSMEAHGTFNLASGQTQPVRMLVEQLREMIDPSASLEFGRIPYREDQIMRLQADVTRLRAATGWRPVVSIAEGLERTVQWHRSRPRGKG